MKREHDGIELQRSAEKGARCDASGAYLNNVPLLRRLPDHRGNVAWVPRGVAALNLDLSAGYCFSIDASRLAVDLCRVAAALNTAEVGVARMALELLQLPSFADRHDGRLDAAEQASLRAKLMKCGLLDGPSAFRRYNPNWPEEPRDEHGRWTSSGTSESDEGDAPTEPVIEPYSPECLRAIEEAKRICIDRFEAVGGNLGFAWMRRCIRSLVPAECGY
jgi:hypothetical protein